MAVEVCWPMRVALQTHCPLAMQTQCDLLMQNRTEENRTLTENLLLPKEEILRLVTRAVAGNRA
jgi:hypothetical protein